MGAGGPAITPVAPVGAPQPHEPELADQDEEGNGGPFEVAEGASLGIAFPEGVPAPLGFGRLEPATGVAPAEDGEVVGAPAGAAQVEVEERDRVAGAGIDARVAAVEVAVAEAV